MVRFVATTLASRKCNHTDPKFWDIKPRFKEEPSKGKSKVYCKECRAFLGMKPGAPIFEKRKLDFFNWKNFI